MEDRKFKPGDVVRIVPAWRDAGDDGLLFVVLEQVKNPCTGRLSRYIIQALNTGLSLPPSQVVEDYMIELVGEVE